MKELNAPWLHWEGHKEHPGARETFARHPELGKRGDGIEFESVVTSLNAAWNKTKLGLAKGRTQVLLRPLFCSDEFNLDSGADFESPIAGGLGGSMISRLPSDSLVDPVLSTTLELPIVYADYDAQLSANDQFHFDEAGERLRGSRDTVFDYMFVERAGADIDYVNALMNNELIGVRLVKAILLVDFTRPVFSTDRCGLLKFVPELAPEELTSTALTEGLRRNLEAAHPAPGTPAAELLANLDDSADVQTSRLGAFSAACRGLGSKRLVANALAATSVTRRLARRNPVLEFDATIPGDALELDAGTRLDPKTCELVTDFRSAR